MSEVNDFKGVSLQDLLCQFLCFQYSKNKDRWFTFPEAEHALFLFGRWDHFDVQRTVSRLIEEGFVEKRPKLDFRWNGGEEGF